MPPRKVLLVDWHAVNGVAQGRRKLILGTNVKETYTCPVKLCLHTDLRSWRGTRRHIETRHPWYYYFDEQPGYFSNRILKFLKIISVSGIRYISNKMFKFLKIINFSGTRYLFNRIFKFLKKIEISGIRHLSNRIFNFLKGNKCQWDKVSFQQNLQIVKK